LPLSGSPQPPLSRLHCIPHPPITQITCAEIIMALINSVLHACHARAESVLDALLGASHTHYQARTRRRSSSSFFPVRCRTGPLKAGNRSRVTPPTNYSVDPTVWARPALSSEPPAHGSASLGKSGGKWDPRLPCKGGYGPSRRQDRGPFRNLSSLRSIDHFSFGAGNDGPGPSSPSPEPRLRRQKFLAEFFYSGACVYMSQDSLVAVLRGLAPN
jgi:hypothetical protein